MTKLVNKIALLCSNHNLDFRNLVEDHNHGGTKGLNSKVDFVIAGPLHNVQTDQNYYHAEHVVYCLSNMKDMSSFIGDMMNPRAYGYVLCTALQFALWEEALARIEKKSRPLAKKILVMSGLKERRARV